MGETSLPEPLSHWATLDESLSKVVGSCVITLFSRSHLCFSLWKCLWISAIIGALKLTRIFHWSSLQSENLFLLKTFVLSLGIFFSNCFFFLIIPSPPSSLFLPLWDSKSENGFSFSHVFSRIIFLFIILHIFIFLSFYWFFSILFLNSLLSFACSFSFTFYSWMNVKFFNFIEFSAFLCGYFCISSFCFLCAAVYSYMSRHLWFVSSYLRMKHEIWFKHLPI